MRLTSSNFTDGWKIPPKHTCDSEGANPQLSWSDFPVETKSFALTCLDPDAPSGEYAHWLMANIPADICEIPENSPHPVGATEITNDSGQFGYVGPCPPNGEHRYIFTIYALDIDHLDGLVRETFVSEVKKHALNSAVLVGVYERIRPEAI